MESEVGCTPECDVPVPAIPSTGNFSIFWWYRNRYRKKLVPEKVSEPVSEKFDTGTDFCRQNLGILKIYNGYRYREFFIFSGGIRTCIGKIWYRKKDSEPVPEKFGTEKSTGIGIENIWYRKKVSVSVSFNILGTVTHCTKSSLPAVYVVHANAVLQFNVGTRCQLTMMQSVLTFTLTSLSILPF